MTRDRLNNLSKITSKQVAEVGIKPRSVCLQSPCTKLEIQPVHPKGDQSWVFIGKTVEAETPVLWPPDAKS